MPSALVSRVDHLAIAVPDLGAVVPLYVDLLGGEPIAGGDDETLRIRTLQLRFPPGVKVELVAPLDAESYLTAYLAKRGPGFHHLTCFVPDVVAASQQLDESGFQTVDLKTGTGVWDETFIRPSSAFGALIQLVTTPLVWSEPILPEGATVPDIVAGRLIWVDARPQWREPR